MLDCGMHHGRQCIRAIVEMCTFKVLGDAINHRFLLGSENIR